ncbi:MAG: NUDIX hydrolase [Alphaproteobacteria bacterium]|nr:NUDIX hydrolase [Alphaproteobacteria bacterium]
MSREYPTHPLPAVLVALVRDNRLLLVQRAKEDIPRKWGLPGGLIELGESPAQAAQRELFEETGVTARAGRLIDQFDVIEADDQGRIRLHYLALVVACEWIEGDPVAASDAAAAGWFDAAQIASLHSHPNLARLAGLVLGTSLVPKG